MTRAGAVLALAVSLVASSAGASPDTRLELLQKYRCALADRLQRLYDAGDPAQDHNRFIVAAMPAPRHGYVQCLFHDNETRVLCEAASGFYETKPGLPRTAHLATEKIAALARLGFSTDDRAGNFSVDRAVAIPPDFGALADFILDALYAGYDARAGDMLDFEAPFAPGMTFGCDPVS